jgi:hypothetical protein
MWFYSMSALVSQWATWLTFILKKIEDNRPLGDKKTLFRVELLASLLQAVFNLIICKCNDNIIYADIYKESTVT